MAAHLSPWLWVQGGLGQHSAWSNQLLMVGLSGVEWCSEADMELSDNNKMHHSPRDWSLFWGGGGGGVALQRLQGTQCSSQF